MKVHLLGLLVGELLSLLLGVALFGIGIADIVNDNYGVILGFVGIFNGVAMMVCFSLYAYMLKKQLMFPKVLIGFSAGLAVVCLQSLFVWSGFQTTLFANYTEKIFELDAAAAGETSQCYAFCTDFKSGSFDLMDTILADTTQDFDLEQAGAIISILALLAQVVVVACCFIMMSAEAKEVGDSIASTEGHFSPLAGNA